MPTRGALEDAVPTDPTIYRLYEVIQVYGPALKALIHEEFGDGIMSAINFKLDLKRVEDPGGDRVVITLDGKFLPYQWGYQVRRGRRTTDLHPPRGRKSRSRRRQPRSGCSPGSPSPSATR